MSSAFALEYMRKLAMTSFGGQPCEARHPFLKIYPKSEAGS